jgi:hypothetical protein
MRGFDNFALSYRVTLRYMPTVGLGQDFDESVVLRMALREILRGQIPLELSPHCFGSIVPSVQSRSPLPKMQAAGCLS